MKLIRYYVKAIAYFKAMEDIGWANYDHEQGIMLSPNIPEKDQAIALEAAMAYGRVTMLLGHAAEYARLFCLAMLAWIIIKLI